MAICSKSGIGLEELRAGEDVAHEADRKERLDAAGAAGDDADRPRRGNRVHRGVAQAVVVAGVDRFFEIGEDTTLARQVLGRGQRLPVHEAHEAGREGDGLAAVVGDAQPDEQVGETHDPETDLAVAGGLGPDGVERIAVHVDHVIEEADAPMDAVPQLAPIDRGPADALAVPRGPWSCGRD